MAKTVLVTYASQTEATAEVAEFIGKNLEEQGLLVTVKPVTQVPDASRFEAVVVGSGVQMEHTYREAQQFLKRSRSTLAQKPLALFITCASLSKDTPEARAKAENYMAQLTSAAGVPVASQSVFAGRMDMARVKGLMGMLMRKSDVKAEDWRDWEAIRQWTLGLAQQWNG